MFDRGWDILDFFRGVRPWSQLLRIADRLPPFSRYKLALVDDDDLQRWREERYKGKPPPPRRPRLDSWTIWDEVLNTLHDGFGMLRYTIQAVNREKGQPKPPKHDPAKRPLTAADRAASRREREQHDELRRKVLPHKYQ